MEKMARQRPGGGLIAAALIAAACLYSITSVAAKPGPPKRVYGAIAYHRESASVGYSYDIANSREAKLQALKQCGNAKCEVLIAFRNACGAIAEGGRNPVAMSGATRQEAETKSLRRCGNPKACRIVAWACTK